MRLEHHLVGGYVRYISPHIIIIMYGIYKTRVVSGMEKLINLWVRKILSPWKSGECHLLKGWNAIFIYFKYYLFLI